MKGVRVAVSIKWIPPSNFMALIEFGIISNTTT